MKGATCLIPIGWTLGQARVALCERRATSGDQERARFNWIMLVADDATTAEALAAAYWRAIADGRAATDDLPALGWVERASADAVDAAGEAVRRDLNARRQVAA